MLGYAALMQLPLMALPGAAVTGPRRAGSMGLGRRRREIEVRRDPWQQGFSRRNWDELQGLLVAERQAADRADELKNAKAKEALDAAADAAREALEQLEQQEQKRAEAVELTRSLNAAARAQGTTKIIAQANAAEKIAKRIIAEFEDEDDAIVMLLS